MHSSLPTLIRVPQRLVLASIAALLTVTATAAPNAPATRPAATAESAALAVSTGQLRGTALDGRRFDLQSLRGTVVLVVFWTTHCPVCRDVMPELRANVAGWRGQPFALVGVSHDVRRSDAQNHSQLVSATVPSAMRFPILWRGDPGFVNTLGEPTDLPSAWLVDKQGTVVERYQGRIPAHAWNRIADLL